MHAMQYEITLPAGYDMEIIRKRVASKGHLLDDFPGLGLKAYLLREREDGSPVNQYAPFYLWATPEGMNSFLWGPGFQGIVNDFGRPVVQHWVGLSYAEGPASSATPRTATRRKVPVPEGVAPAEAVAQALARHERQAATEGVVASAVAVDPRHWEVLHFTLWAGTGDEVPADTAAGGDAGARADTAAGAGERFQVLYVASSPDRAALGRAGQG
ncbi:DUF4865 family protein [Streptomyces sp. ISL-36]|uniref:DUF4865 family protein n=1 Tax=Streptomyces sp. ISL-36 TaxID=2819182 RepID=UPI001BE9F6C6|nr:DUF4865 family protein [Streptomyces sp. ISL-36]MBT2442065.1 DUF4865 family protein [Streptomyces sp. ISL-36]